LTSGSGIGGAVAAQWWRSGGAQWRVRGRGSRGGRRTSHLLFACPAKDSPPHFTTS